MKEKFYLTFPSPTMSASPIFELELKTDENSGLALPSRIMSGSPTLGLELRTDENSGLALPRGIAIAAPRWDLPCEIEENSCLALPGVMLQLSEDSPSQSCPPYLIISAPQSVSPALAFTDLMDELSSPSSQELEWTGTEAKDFLIIRRMVATEFWRSEMHSKLTQKRPPILMRKHIYAEVAIWRAILRLLERLNTFDIVPNPLLTFRHIIEERKLTLFTCSCGEERIGATELIKALQTENKQLQGLQNPFSPDHAPITCCILDKAIPFADRMDGFRKDFYMKVVRARMRFVTMLKKEHVRASHKGKVEHRGRKKSAERK
jgi:hypothetical protein